jgi:hypothetical protein
VCLVLRQAFGGRATLLEAPQGVLVVVCDNCGSSAGAEQMEALQVCCSSKGVC